MQVTKGVAMKRTCNSRKRLGDPRELVQTACKDADQPEDVSFPNNCAQCTHLIYLHANMLRGCPSQRPCFSSFQEEEK